MKVFFMLILICNHSIAQHQIIPTNTSTRLIQMKKSGQTLYIVGVQNFFAKCENGCDSIHLLSTPGPINYFNAHLNVLDSNTIYLSSFLASNPYHAIVSKSIDGGQSWNSILDTISMEFYTVGMFAFDTSTICLTSSQERTFITQDGGASWNIGTNHGIDMINAYDKLNDSTVIVGGLSQLSVTTDKGNTWNYHSFLQGTPTDFEMQSLDSIYAVSSGIFGTFLSLITGTDQEFRLDKLIPDFSPVGITVVSNNEIYIVGQGWPQGHGRIMKTTDMGTTWSYHDIPDATNLVDMLFINDSIALISGYDGILVKWNKNDSMTPWGLGLEDQESVNAIQIYPNPTSNLQVIQLSDAFGKRLKITLYDLQGRAQKIVFDGIIDQSNFSIPFELLNYAPGMYYYEFVLDGEVIRKEALKY